MKELIIVKTTEVNCRYGNVIREETRKFENNKGLMYYIFNFMAVCDAKVSRYLSDGIVLTYYDSNNKLIEAVITYRVEGSE